MTEPMTSSLPRTYARQQPNSARRVIAHAKLETYDIRLMVGCAVTFGRVGGCADTDALYALLHFAPSVPVVRVKKCRAAFPIVCGA